MIKLGSSKHGGVEAADPATSRGFMVEEGHLRHSLASL